MTDPHPQPAIRHFNSAQSLVDFVGQAAIVSRPVVIEQKMIDRFAQVTQDHQWIHVDPQRASTQSPYGCTIAHGFLVLSLLTCWQSSCMAFPQAALLLNYGFDKIRYTAAVPSGASVSAAFTLDQVTLARPGEARCAWNVTISAKDAARAAVHARWLTMVCYPQA